MNAPSLDPVQYALVAFLFDAVGLEDPVTPLEFSLEGAFKGKYFAMVGVPTDTDERVSLVCTLPRYSQSCFLALTRDRELEVARLLANLEDLEREKATTLSSGEVVGHTSASPSGGFPPYASILMPVAISKVLQGLPSEAAIQGKTFHFHLVLPLTKEELACRNSDGHDAMLDMFQQNGKSLFFC